MVTLTAGHKIALLSLLPHVGHVIPLLRCARAARSAGFDVRLFVPDDVCGVVRSHGFEAHGTGPVWPEGARKVLHDVMASGFGRRLAYLERQMAELRLGQLAAVVDAIDVTLGALRAFEPSLLVTDAHGLVLRECAALAGSLGVPWIVHHAEGAVATGKGRNPWEKTLLPSLVRRLETRALSVGSNLQLAAGQALGRSTVRAESNRVQRARARFGAESAAVRPFAHISTGLGPLEIERLGRRPEPGDATQYLGPLAPLTGKGLTSDDVSWLEADDPRPVAYVCFGTMVQPQPSFRLSLVRAARSRGVRLLWAGPVDPGLAPQDGRWVTWIDQPAAIAHPRVRAVVSQGGSGSTQEALWHGKPGLVVPVAWDQHYNAWVVRSLGCGASVDHRRARPDSVERALASVVMEPTPRACAEEVGASLRRLDAEHVVADVFRRAVQR